MARRGIMVGMAGLVLLLTVPAMADFYDRFEDGNWSDPNFQVGPTPRIYWQGSYSDVDPNCYDANVVGWDIDNLNWQLWDLGFGAGFAETVDADGLNLGVTGGDLIGTGIYPALMSYAPWSPTFPFPDLNEDPNEILTMFNSDESHYILAFVKWKHEDPCQPGRMTGENCIGLHVQPMTWLGGMWFGLNPSKYLYMHSPKNGQAMLWGGAGLSRSDLDYASGIWMLLQFDVGDSNDPNTMRWRSAAWNGDKTDPYTWDGDWDLVSNAYTGEVIVGNPSSDWDPSDYDFLDSGVCSLLTYGLLWSKQPCHAAYDNVEARRGVFTNVAHTLDLTIRNGHMGTIVIDPDLPDPNDPNTADARLCRFTNGTEVVLTAAPLSGKSLKEWIIYDPNHPGDANYMAVDTNTVLYLTMDADWEIQAAFKCGGSVPPFIAMTLLALGMAVVVRRVL